MDTIWQWLRGLFLAKPEPAQPELEADKPEEDTDCPYCAATADEPCNCASIYGDPDYEYDFAREQELERE